MPFPLSSSSYSAMERTLFLILIPPRKLLHCPGLTIYVPDDDQDQEPKFMNEEGKEIDEEGEVEEEEVDTYATSSGCTSSRCDGAFGGGAMTRWTTPSPTWGRRRGGGTRDGITTPAPSARTSGDRGHPPWGCLRVRPWRVRVLAPFRPLLYCALQGWPPSLSQGLLLRPLSSPAAPPPIPRLRNYYRSHPLLSFASQALLLCRLARGLVADFTADGFLVFDLASYLLIWWSISSLQSHCHRK